MSEPPLWEVIDRAWWSLVDTAEPHASPPASDQAACVIRALRDWLVPADAPRPDAVYAGTRWDKRQRLRALLTAEADRAERGRPPMPDPSPTARAIVQAFDDRYELLGPLEDDWQEQCLAAALVALADHVAPSDAVEPRNYLPAALECQRIRGEILAIAAELSGDG